MTLFEDDNERAEAYRILADLFAAPPDSDRLQTIQEDFGLESKESEQDVLADFNDLFLYPGGKIPPLESLYSEGDSIAESVEAFYYRSGLAFEEEYELVPDHISLEFLFMSYIIDINNHELQEKFLEEHVANWVPYYCEEVIGQAQTLFYREIAEIARDFIRDEYEGLR
ncbi:MAG: molecular chaperone TorD family protein [Nitrospiraceae bacterium]|nr:molecular chaperone TorD family protein [Nitrospiraceae bacterium]